MLKQRSLFGGQEKIKQKLKFIKTQEKRHKKTQEKVKLHSET